MNSNSFYKPPFFKDYKILHLGVRSVLFCIDQLLSIFFKRKFKLQPPQNPQKILFCNLAHLGDLILASSLLPYFKQAYPEAKIGFVIGSHSRELLQSHPKIDFFHIVDHWKLNRRSISFWKKVKHYISSLREAYSEMKLIKYDISIDLYHYYGNTILLAWLLNIPFRVGFQTGGLSPLLNFPLPIELGKSSIIHSYEGIIKILIKGSQDIVALKPCLPPLTTHHLNDLKTLYPILKKPYLLVHPGSYQLYKWWPKSSWKQLLEDLKKFDYPVVISGQGPLENRIASEFEQEGLIDLNLVDKLSITQLRALIQQASAFFGVDSMAGHLAKASQVPTFLIYHGINPLTLWHFDSSYTHLLSKKVPCAPCQLRNGCASMKCIQEVSSQEVLAIFKDKMELSG